jgi:rod shape-determining protein MreC
MGTQPTTRLAKRRIALRRVVLGSLVVVSIGLFSAYFRETESGALHGVQARTGSMVAPLESITDRAVRPFRDGWNWVTSLVNARDRAAELEKEVAQLRAELVQNASEEAELARLRQTVGFPDEIATGYKRVPARIHSRSPMNLYGRARISVGTNDDVVTNSIVVTGNKGRGALVGYVITAQARSSVVSFITDPRTGVGVRVQGSNNAPAILGATYEGNLELENVPGDYPLAENAVVETSGFSTPELPSIYPSGIPVGQVEQFDPIESEVYRRVQVRPFVDVRSLSEVVVLAPVSEEARRRAAG